MLLVAMWYTVCTYGFQTGFPIKNNVPIYLFVLNKVDKNKQTSSYIRPEAFCLCFGIDSKNLRRRVPMAFELLRPPQFNIKAGLEFHALFNIAQNIVNP